jgi:eukaryotic-like serine/threonine-protein kinase
MHDGFHGPVGVREGDILVGKYRVERVLGFGGMGVVVAAQHLGLDQRVAIKFLFPEAFSHPEAIVRFDREARAAAKIKSAHVARVTDVGTLENGAPYMVMEYLEGEDLAACLKREGALRIEEAVHLVLQACEAIDEAHKLGIIHRDLKPANLFCIRQSDGSRSIKVLDFGISKLTHTVPTMAGMAMTSAEAMMGSPLYMSPEQMQAPRTVDERTDLWGIGVMLYELLAGDVPFKGETIPQVCFHVTTQPTPPLRQVRPEVPAALERVVARCLEKERTKRFATVADLAVALLPFAPSEKPTGFRAVRQSSSAELATSSVTVPPPSTRARKSPRQSVTDSSWEDTKQRFVARRRRTGLGRMAAIAVLTLGATGAVWLNRESVRSSFAPSDNGTLEPAPTLTAAPLAPTRAAIPAEPPSVAAPIVSPDLQAKRDDESRKLRAPEPREPPRRARVAAPTSAVAPRVDTETTPKPSRVAPVHEPSSPPPNAATPAPVATPHEELTTGANAPSCTLNLTSIPACEVTLDGIGVGTTPLFGVLTTSGLRHTITLTHAEQGTKVMTVTCRPGEVKHVAARLGPRVLLDGI